MDFREILIPLFYSRKYSAKFWKSFVQVGRIIRWKWNRKGDVFGELTLCGGDSFLEATFWRKRT